MTSFIGNSKVANLADYRGKVQFVTTTAIFATDAAEVSHGEIEGGMMATEGEVRQAELAVVGAQTDTKIARLEGKLDLVIVKLDTVNENTLATRREIKDSERSIKANAWVPAVGLLAVIVGLAFGLPSIFDLGMKLRETISKEIHEQVQTLPSNTPR